MPPEHFAKLKQLIGAFPQFSASKFNIWNYQKMNKASHKLFSRTVQLISNNKTAWQSNWKMKNYCTLKTGIKSRQTAGQRIKKKLSENTIWLSNGTFTREQSHGILLLSLLLRLVMFTKFCHVTLHPYIKPTRFCQLYGIMQYIA